jgi:dCTP deaminase
LILTDREIRIFLERGVFEIAPKPEPAAFASSSVDLTLDQQISLFRLPKPGVGQYVDPAAPGFKSDNVIKEITDPYSIDPKAGYDLEPNTLILAWTREFVDLKDSRLAARVEGKSSLARLGLAIHVTAPTIHAGFSGSIRLEVINHGPMPIRLRTGMRICQLVFEQTLGTPDKGYQGQFVGQTAVA